MSRPGMVEPVPVLPLNPSGQGGKPAGSHPDPGTTSGAGSEHVRPAPLPPHDEGGPEGVWAAWSSYHPGHRRALPASKRALLASARGALQHGGGYESLAVLVRWCHEADEDLPRWMRGHNPRGRAYLGLESLLRLGPLEERVAAAWRWRLAQGRAAERNGSVAGLAALRLVAK